VSFGFIEGLSDHWLWFAAAAILGILEIFLPGIFLVWIAAAAGITGLAVVFLPLTLAFQLGLFALLAIASVYAGRLYYQRNPVASTDPKLNERASRLIGQIVTVETAIENGKGRVRVGDGVWNARGADAPAGSQVRIVTSDGTCLNVEPSP
jgi:membrane protein implicated in regulation of membrane protease activity